MARLVIFVLTALLLTVLVGPSRANSAEVETIACPDHQESLQQTTTQSNLRRQA